MQLSKARRIAESLATALAPGCHKIEIAGSVRRESAEVNDIEIVCVSRLRAMRIPGSLFPVTTSCVLALTEQLVHSEHGCFRRGFRWGERWRQLNYYAAGEQVTVDLFIVQPGSFGPQLAIRTGPAEFSKLLVSRAMPEGYRMKDGVIRRIDDGLTLSFPEEPEFFGFLGLPWWHARERTAFALTRFLDEHAMETTHARQHSHGPHLSPQEPVSHPARPAHPQSTVRRTYPHR